MQFNEALDYLYARLPMFQRVGAAAYKKDLTNTLALCAALGAPHRRFPTIHIAGTNGKGSVSSMLAAVLQSAGYERVGLYTSPHLTDFTERIRINGQPALQSWVADFVTRHQALIERIEPSFFEVTVAMAFQYFAESQVDVAIVEVGLGGRLDSTNVITPELSVVTNISWDHAEMLGDSLAKIAAEKAGIFKARVPAVVGQWTDETRPVFEAKAAEVGAPLMYAPATVTVLAVAHAFDRQQVRATYADGRVLDLTLDLTGDYQLENVQTVLAAIEQLRASGWSISDEAIRTGLGDVRRLAGLRGRMELLGTAPLVLADVAHNEAGIRSVMQQFMAQPAADRHIVFGVVQEKDLSRIIPHLPHDNVTYYFVKPNIPRGLDAIVLQDHAEAAGLIGAYYPSVEAGLKAALAFAAPDDTVLITGSLFVVGEALEAYSKLKG